MDAVDVFLGNLYRSVDDVFLENLNQIITSCNLSLVINEKHQLQSLEKEIKYLSGFLKVTEKKRFEHPEVMDLVIKIIDLVYEAKNIVSDFGYHALKFDRELDYGREHQDHSLSGFLKGKGKSILLFKEEMEILTATVKRIYDEHMYDINEVAVIQLNHSSTDPDLDPHREILIEDPDPTFTGGGGDSGLSRGSQTSKVGKENGMVGFKEDVNRIKDKLDDRGEGKSLEIISIIATGGAGKTTLAREVYEDPFTSYTFGIRAGNYVPYYLAPLPNVWSWELLKKKVFGMKCCCPPELVGVGKQIAEKCEGLPLAVVIIAGILATEDKTLDVWEKVSEHLSSIIAQNQEDCMEILELSYNHLPLHLKVCFLLIGGYPEDKEILVRELIWLWIVEGFIQRSEGGESLEAIAQDYLIGLIDRSLVQVAWKSPLGGIKTCRIHDLLRELCFKKAEDDNFLVKVYQNDSFSPSATNEHRRLFIGRHFFEKFSFRPRNLRPLKFLTMLTMSQLDRETQSSVAGEIQEHVEVLIFLSGGCNEEISIGNLVHLRYLALTLNQFPNVTPFSSLLNLETLNLNVPTGLDRPTICLPCDIIKMVKLRHLYTKDGAFTFHLSGEETGPIVFDPCSKLDSLQTLHHLCACKGCRSFLLRTPNLRKLGLYGGKSPEDNVARFPDLEFLKCLETLTFTVDHASHVFLADRTLPRGLKLPLSITRITFQYTGLMWKELSLLQTLPSLEVLIILRFGCGGAVWNMSELDGFPQLKYLKLHFVYIEEWIASEDQFPKLEVLVVEYCTRLKRIPIDFANLNELREIKLVRCRRTVEESAMEIRNGQRNRKGDDDCLDLFTKLTWG